MARVVETVAGVGVDSGNAIFGAVVWTEMEFLGLWKAWAFRVNQEIVWVMGRRGSKAVVHTVSIST